MTSGLQRRDEHELTAGRPRAGAPDAAVGVHRFTLAAALCDQVRALADAVGTTPSVVLVAAFQTLLHRYSGETDVLVAAPARDAGEDGTSGLRADLTGDPGFGELLRRVRPAEAHPPVAFAFAAGEGSVEAALVDAHAALGCDLACCVSTSHGDAAGLLVYRCDRFERATVERLAAQYARVLASVAADASLPISRIRLLSATETRRVLVDFGAGPTRADPPSTLPALFAERVAAAPSRRAVVDDAGELTYAELDARAGRVAARLAAHGAGPESLVGICLERGAGMLAGLLGILRAGAAYVPLDPRYPQERLRFMLEDSGARLLLTETRLRDRIPSPDAAVLLLDADDGADASAPLRPPRPDNLAYVIYTSGSTGTPKGVQIEHRALVNLLRSMSRRPGFEPGETLLAVTTLSFDIAALELFLPLVAGGTVVVVSDEVARDGRLLVERARSSGAGVMQATPSTWRLLVDAGWEGGAIVRALCGGEALPPALARALRARAPELWNLFGPTETTIWSTIDEIAPEAEHVTIGGPIENTRAYVLDGRLEPTPPGVSGELYIGGDGVARGYFARPALTAERFVPDPFGPPGSRLYRTGDRARFAADGRIEFLGRLDDQVKIRGHRIELGEIESVLGRRAGVGSVTVNAHDDPVRGPYLIAYAVPRARPSDAGGDGDGRESLAAEQVAAWRGVFAAAYEERHDPTFDISGWRSSYTGAPFDPEDMREWVDGAVARILELRPGRVLELGCGTGLLTWRLAPTCSSYVGTDLCGERLARLRDDLRRAGIEHVSLLEREATDLAGFEPRAVDAVVLNSVVQYFPDAEYLLRALTGAVELVCDGGHVFVGDVRHLALQRALHASVALARSSDDAPAAELAADVTRRVAEEDELLVEPALFRALPSRLERVASVRVLPKGGRRRTEMADFRYDVVLEVGERRRAAAEPAWVEWESLPALDAALSAAPGVLAVRGVPNRRSAATARVAEALQAPEPGVTARDLRPAGDDGGGAVDPEDLAAAAERHRFSVDVTWEDGRSDGALRAVFARGGVDPPPAGSAQPPAAEWRREWVNDPLASRRERERHRSLVQELEAAAEAALPDYMRPSGYVVREAMPLLPNGKIDRRALVPPPHAAREHVAPVTAAERWLAAAWAEALDRSPIGVADDFVELGGTSLVASRIAAQAARHFVVDLSVAHVLRAGTVRALAETVEGLVIAAAEADDLAAALDALDT